MNKMVKKKLKKSPSEIVGMYAAEKDLQLIYMEVIKQGYSVAVASEVLKLIIQWEYIEDFFKKKEKPRPVQ